MCLTERSSAILRGFYRIRSIGISLALLTTFACDTRGHMESNIDRLAEARSYESLHEDFDAATKTRHIYYDEDILIGHSGDPWGVHNDSKDLRKFQIRSQLLEQQIENNGTNEVGLIKRRRSKRSVVHLYNMVVCATGCNPISYKGYGCFCGFLGSGSAVDGIDQCCKMHDRCYDATECPTFLEYFVPYYWKCYRGYRPICAVEHGKWGGSGSCAQRLCECDRALSMCLRRFPCPTSKAVCTTSPWRLIQNIFMIF